MQSVITRKVKLKINKKFSNSDFYKTLYKNYILNIYKKELRVSDKDIELIIRVLK